MTTTQQQACNPSFKNPDGMPEYVSIYEMKPKRKQTGRPKSCKLTEEEQKKERAKAISRKCYYDNHEYCKLQQRSHKQAVREAKKMMFESALIFVFSLTDR